MEELGLWVSRVIEARCLSSNKPPQSHRHIISYNHIIYGEYLPFNFLVPQMHKLMAPKAPWPGFTSSLQPLLLHADP